VSSPRIYKNEVIDLRNTKISKNHHVKKTSFQIHLKKTYSKNNIIFLVIKFEKNFEIFLTKFKSIGDSFGESNYVDGI